jgi:pSer/pThr/pTyr-binding forkhead associated (FHA) protein
MAKLILKFGGSVLKEIPLDQSQVTIGRKPDNSLVIDNLAVSGHHARVVQENGTYFVEDTGSTNGTFLNDVKVDKRRLQHGDQIRVGKHVLSFEDSPGDATLKPAAVSSDDKTVLTTMRSKRVDPSEAGGSDALPGGKMGVMLVVAGQTDKNEYKLTGKVSVIGSQDAAAVKLTGWFAPRVAAIISRTETAYIISMSEEARKVMVNGVEVKGRSDLKDGDLIEVAGVKMYFYLRHPTT